MKLIIIVILITIIIIIYIREDHLREKNIIEKFKVQEIDQIILTFLLIIKFFWKKKIIICMIKILVIPKIIIIFHI